MTELALMRPSIRYLFSHPSHRTVHSRGFGRESIFDATLVQKRFQVAFVFVCLEQMVQPFFGTVNRVVERVSVAGYVESIIVAA